MGFLFVGGIFFVWLGFFKMKMLQKLPEKLEGLKGPNPFCQSQIMDIISCS